MKELMRKLVSAPALVLLAVPSFGTAGYAQTSGAARTINGTGHRFCQRGLESPAALAAKMEESLRLDPSGKRVLRGCAANPLLFLEGFQKADPNANLTSVNQLPGYLRTLVQMDDKDNADLDVSCLRDRADGVRYVVMKCEARAREPGEVSYGNPKTNKIVLMSRCANPVLGYAEIPVVAAKCPEVRYPTMPKIPGKGAITSVSVRFTILSDREQGTDCHQLTAPGLDKTYTGGEYPAQCPDTYPAIVGGRQVQVTCRWERVEFAASEALKRHVRVQNYSGSYYAKGDGTASWKVPRSALEGMVTVCWEIYYADGTYLSLTEGVDRDDYVNGVATITNAHIAEGLRAMPAGS